MRWSAQEAWDTRMGLGYADGVAGGAGNDGVTGAR